MSHTERPVRIIQPVVPENLVAPGNQVARYNFDYQYYEPLRNNNLAIIDLSIDGGHPSEGIVDATADLTQKADDSVLLAYYDVDPNDKRPVIHMQQNFFSNGRTQKQREAALKYLAFKACFLGAPKFECNIYIDYTEKNAPGVNEYDLAALLKSIGYYWNFEFEMAKTLLARGTEKSSKKNKSK